MKSLINVGPYDLYFSNPGEGFQFSVIEHDGSVERYLASLNLVPWESLPSFVSTVVDYSWNNGLTEVKNQGLQELEDSLIEALRRVQKEQTYRRDRENNRN